MVFFVSVLQKLIGLRMSSVAPSSQRRSDQVSYFSWVVDKDAWGACSVISHSSLCPELVYNSGYFISVIIRLILPKRCSHQTTDSQTWRVKLLTDCKIEPTISVNQTTFKDGNDGLSQEVFRGKLYRG